MRVRIRLSYTVEVDSLAEALPGMLSDFAEFGEKDVDLECVEIGQPEEDAE